MHPAVDEPVNEAIFGTQRTAVSQPAAYVVEEGP